MTFHHPMAFWLGTVMTTVGVLLHLPMYIEARHMEFHMAGMPMGLPMMIGMLLIIVGLATALYGLYPSRAFSDRPSQIRVRALDETPMGVAHVGLLVVMALALIIDAMKTTSLAFVLPGMALEYGLRSPVNPTGKLSVAYLPLAGVGGTVLGSLIWGWLGDRIGRRSAILFAGLVFIGTSVCGTMPSYNWNLFMCFLMGLGAGGMLPIVYALMAETIPARHRGWLMVLMGGNIGAAYVLTSWAASDLVPTFSWRILWLLGLPTGLLLIFLNRWIPESPRYLLATGREAEAISVMKRYGAKVVPAPSELDAEEEVRSRWAELFSGPLLSQTALIVVLGLGIGLVLFGFNLWIPSNLQKLGLPDVAASTTLRNSALIGLPFTFAVAWMYGFWSSKKTMVVLAALTTVATIGFAVAGDTVASNELILVALLVLLICGMNAVASVLSVYSSEIYPTPVRSHGTGLAAGASKAGGILIVALVVFGAATPSIAQTALIGGIPLALATVFILFLARETRNRQLEDISAEELGVTPSVQAVLPD